MALRGGLNKKDHARIKKQIPSLGVALAREWKGALRKHGDWWFGRMADRFRAPLTRYGHVNPHSTLHNRSGNLRNSLHKKVQGTRLKALSLRMWSDAPYARLQEYGGVIRARGGGYLAIPVDDNLTPAGKPRYRSPRDPALSDGRFLELPSGTLWFVLDTPGDVKFLFALRKEVDIPGPGPQARRKRPSRLGMRNQALGIESKRLLRRRIVVGARRAIVSALGGGSRGS